MREAFEATLRDNPNDVAGWCAYADWLVEQGDPRGEFMQVQLALEEEGRPKRERTALKKREAKLLAAHEREWLGELSPHFNGHEIVSPDDSGYEWDRPAPAVQHRWRRGRLADVTAECITVKLAQALADAPAARALDTLRVTSTAYNLGMQDEATPRRVPPPPEYRTYDEWLDLLGAPCLRSVRVFQLGDTSEPPEDGWCDNHTRAYGIERLVAEMPRVEELHLICKSYNATTLFALPSLSHLRVLRMYALGEPYASPGGYEIPLDILAANPALRNLTHLSLHPHFAGDRSFVPLGRVAPLLRSPHLPNLAYLQLRLSDMGDDGVREVVASGILKRLRWLDLRHGCVTDDGARLFAACPDARNLERLDLSRNAVTAVGLAALRAAGVNAVANNPQTQEELDSREYLREGDFE